MKSLQFDVVDPPPEVCRDIVPDHPLQWALIEKSSKKTWYEQTLEEDGEEAELSPLEVRFSSSIKIGDPEPESASLGVQDSNDADQSDPPLTISMASTTIDNEDHLLEVEALAKEWESNNNYDMEGVDLDWTEEDEVAYREVANPLTEAEDFMVDDDLLGEEFLEEKKGMPTDVTEHPLSSLPPASKLGRPKLKGKRSEPKKDQKKKDQNSKVHLGPNDLLGAASKKLLHLQGRFSPRLSGSTPVQAKQKQQKNSTNPPSRQVSNPTLKDPASPGFVGKGEFNLLPVPET